MLIEKSLKITIKQADVELAIKELIRREDPTIVVDTISFQPKRAGADSIGITVGAHFAETVEEKVSQEVEETVEVPPFEADPVKEDEEDIPATKGLFE